jgi:hypothetical protein
VGIAGCKSSDAVLLSVRADAPVEQYDLYVRDDSTGQVIFHSGFNSVTATGESPRDLTKSALKIALKLSRGGRFTLLVVGVIGDLAQGKPAPGATQLFWAGHVKIDGATELSAKLLTVPRDPDQNIDDDQDRDLWPDATDFVAHVPEAAQMYAGKTDLLDCDDKIDMPANDDGTPTKLLAADINPFATETCGDSFDQNCNGNGDEECVDQDGDGDPKGSDCDDNDPNRHHPTAADPFPDPKNCCGYNLGKKGTPDEGTDFTGTPLCPMKRCGDGIDNSCRAVVNDPRNDTICEVDDDCDGYLAPPQGNDCDDHDPTVHPGALEPCGSTRDLNCSGGINEGCVPCDLDGDGYQRNDPQNSCPNSMDTHPGMSDCNDNDSGVYPGSIGGKDSGEGDTMGGKLKGALRGTCRNKNPDGTLQDSDCNGKVAEGCPETDPDPTKHCDKDGDGFPEYPGNCDNTQPKIDCNDADPTIYPGAPDKCGDGIAQNCVADGPCTNDADHDGYNAGDDCDDGNPAAHPWAKEACNGKDDDCDGLVDEGNPDQNGDPMVTNGKITTCTDDNDGECAKTLGRCVCSTSIPSGTTDPAGKRNFCPTEQVAGAKPPRCFGAGQPSKQTCDSSNPKDDDCDGRVDDPTGMNLAILGQQCGVDVGQCRSGTVVGCDQTMNNCFAQFGRIPTARSWYVCSTDSVCPVMEKCNGLDDDCDGTLAGSPTIAPAPGSMTNDEYDHDGDKYLACSGCDPSALAPGILGCGDCDDTRGSNMSGGVYPGHAEFCDDLDNNCVNGITDDGADECTGATPTCCSAQSACKNLQTDKNNCNGCGNVCPGTRAVGELSDRCVGGACKCGNSGQCAGPNAGQYCNTANSTPTCDTCNTNTHCGVTCADCTVGGSGNVCKSDGSGCTGCNVDQDCVNKNAAIPYCHPGGVCRATKPLGYTCGAGTECYSTFCADGKCCNTGCGGACDVCSSALCTAGGTSCSDGTCTNISGAGAPSCSPYVCRAAGSGCPTSCTVAGTSQCAAGYTCAGAPAGTCKKVNGSACTTTGECASGACECMDAACTSRVCCATGCTPDTCTSGTHHKFACGGGTCAEIGTGNSCSPYTCGTTTCNTICSAASCTAGSSGCASGYCQGMNGTCLTSMPNGCTGCSDGPTSSCTSGQCKDGHCCDTACGTACHSCVTGTCSNVGSLTGVEDNPECQTTQMCNASQQCLIKDGQTCTTPSTSDASCFNGHCVSKTGGGGVCCGSACAVGTVCVGNVPTGTTCDSGTCSSAPGSNCNPYKCAGGACPSSCSCGASPCNDTTNCNTGNYCNGSTCAVDDNSHCENPLVDCSTRSTFNGFTCTNGTCGCTALTLATDCGARGNSCLGGACKCNLLTACSSGQCCNALGCGTVDTDNHCGSSCTNCTTGPDNKKCVSSSCGCNADSDCSATKYCASNHQCATRISSGMPCADSNCAVAGCNQCMGGVACPPVSTDMAGGVDMAGFPKCP